LFNAMFRVPYGWRKNADGTLTNQIETDEYKQMVAYMRRLNEAGAYHPDSATMQWSQYFDAFLGGTLAVHNEGFVPFFGENGIINTVQTTFPGAQVVGIIPPGHDGGKGVTYNTAGNFGFTGISASAGQDPARVKELLGVMNYLVAPTFSEEQIFLQFGLPDVHFTVDEKGIRQLTDKGTADVGNLTYFAWPEGQVFYFPDRPEDAKYAQSLAKEILAIGITDPVQSVYSPTNSAKSAELNQLGRDRIAAIVTGREPLEALDKYIADWRSRGGDEIRKEYETALNGA
jgi:putative aldouronate transport system substrate-binding protein